jgi:hypothetical protein
MEPGVGAHEMLHRNLLEVAQLFIRLHHESKRRPDLGVRIRDQLLEAMTLRAAVMRDLQALQSMSSSITERTLDLAAKLEVLCRSAGVKYITGVR